MPILRVEQKTIVGNVNLASRHDYNQGADHRRQVFLLFLRRAKLLALNSEVTYYSCLSLHEGCV